MTIAASAIKGIHKAEALLGVTATRLAGQGTPTDAVSLSETALALIQARIAVSVNATAFRVGVEIQKGLIDVVG